MTLILTACAVLFALPMGALLLSSWISERHYPAYRSSSMMSPAQWAEIWLIVCVAIGMGIGWVVTR